MAPPASVNKPSASSPRPSTPSPATLVSGSSNSGASGEQGQDEKEDDEETPNADTPAVASVPSVASGLRQLLETPTKNPRELLAGLQIKSAQAKKAKDFGMYEAIKTKIAELEAAGWRPEVEIANLDHDEDDDYDGVDLINDSDESHKTMRLEEERAMFLAGDITADEQTALARRLSLDTNGTDEMDLTILDDLDDVPGEIRSVGMLLEWEHETKLGRNADDDIFRPSSSDSAAEQRENQRRVRFEDEIDGSDAGSVDSELVAETFPDLFMEAHQLGPAILQMTEDDFLLDDRSDAGSCWDFDGDADMQLDMDDDDDDDDSSEDSVDESSGFDCRLMHPVISCMLLTRSLSKPTKARPQTRKRLPRRPLYAAL